MKQYCIASLLLLTAAVSKAERTHVDASGPLFRRLNMDPLLPNTTASGDLTATSAMDTTAIDATAMGTTTSVPQADLSASAPEAAANLTAGGAATAAGPQNGFKQKGTVIVNDKAGNPISQANPLQIPQSGILVQRTLTGNTITTHFYPSSAMLMMDDFECEDVPDDGGAVCFDVTPREQLANVECVEVFDDFVDFDCEVDQVDDWDCDFDPFPAQTAIQQGGSPAVVGTGGVNTGGLGLPGTVGVEMGTTGAKTGTGTEAGGGAAMGNNATPAGTAGGGKGAAGGGPAGTAAGGMMVPSTNPNGVNGGLAGGAAAGTAASTATTGNSVSSALFKSLSTIAVLVASLFA
ncbi:hypothetical protein BC830DRAFT_1116792 [Chytriomyces sp. MP71]|nr:hypothetical protein BC830DRAFT_1116792 [Chytriomyces sp. MP71]